MIPVPPPSSRPERAGSAKGGGDGKRLGGALNAMTGVFGRAANQIIALVVTLLAARWLTPATFGAFAIAAAFVAFTRTMLYAGAYEYLLKAPRGEEANSECLAVNVGLAAVLGAALEGLAAVSSPVFHTPLVGWLLALLAPSSLLSAAANWQEAQMLRNGRIKTYYGVTTAAEVVAAAVTITMILMGFSLGALVAQIYVRLFTLMAAYRLLQRPAWSQGFSAARAWRVAAWSTHRYGTTVVTFLSNYSADILLGVFLSPAATGLYRASHRTVTGVSDLISNPTRMTAVTIFSRRSAEGQPSGPLWSGIAAASALLGWTALAGLAAVSGQVVPLVLGARWKAASPIIAILCLQRAFSLIDGVTAPLLVAFDHARSLLGVQIAMAVGSVVLLALMAPLGVAAAAWSSVLIAGASMTICIALAARLFPGFLGAIPGMLPVAVGPALATGVAALVAARLSRGVAHGPIAGLALEVGAGAFAFAAATFILRKRVARALRGLNPSPAPLSPVPVSSAPTSPVPTSSVPTSRADAEPLGPPILAPETAAVLDSAIEAEAWDYST